VEINIHDKIQTNFPVLDVFVKVACHISRGGTLEVIGKSVSEIRHLKQFEPLVNSEKDQILGHVIYIDNYGNVITNISRKLFETVGKGREFKISARRLSFSEIFETYSHAINFNIEKEKRKEEDGKKLAVFNSAGYIELAMYKSNPSSVGGAASLFGLEYLDTVTINFQ
jgi:S-adenosyl-L-methionine hydrolase (adenosine-forming)